MIKRTVLSCRQRLLVVVAAVAALVITAAPAARADTGGAHSAPHAASTAPGDANPYGNLYNDYLREPYGVPPAGQDGTPAVHDDPNPPFDWYRSPRASLGVFGGVQETMISPQGWLQNDFGTLKFYTGEALAPIDQRVKTWKSGWLPIAELDEDTAGARYHFEYFDTTVPGMAPVPVSETYGVSTRQQTVRADVDNIVTFAKVTLTNTSSRRDSFSLGVGLGSETITSPQHRGAPRPSDISFDSGDKALVGGVKALFTVSAAPTEVVGGAEHVLRYTMTLAPGESQDLVVKLPYWVAERADVDALHAAPYGRHLASTTAFWTKTTSESGSVRLPEAKIDDAYRANVVQLLAGALDIVGDHWWMVANPTIYNRFYVRDSAFHIEALLDAGLADVARHVLWDYPAWQDPESGRYVGLQSTQFDANGEALWSIGQYYRRTHDQEFAEHVWPSVEASMAWEWQYRQDNWETSGGLYPVNSIADNEQVQGHIVGFNLWAISGEFAAADLARGLGKDAASTWEQRAREYAGILREKVTPQFTELGFVPTSTEGIEGDGLRQGWYGDSYGIDWGNLGLVWPSGVFDPHDPMVTDSLRAWAAKEREGVFTYPADGRESVLHSYAPDGIPEAYLRGGDQWDALRYIYDMLVHTSAMHMASEGMDASTRNDWSTANNTEPHNQFSAEFVSVVRDMLAYEQPADDSLHLANAYSGEWTSPGKQISFAGPSSFGPLSYTIRMGLHGMTMELDPPTRDVPDSIVVSTPQGTVVQHVGGVHADVSGNHITMHGLDQPVTLEVTWSTDTPTPGYSYKRAVADYLANYRRMTAPPEMSVSDVAATDGTVTAGDPVTVRATVVNAGGAARLANHDVTLYVDGKPVATDNTTLARGVGFSTPDGVISFDRNTEGRVPVTVSAQVCGLGRHEIAVGVAGQPPVAGASVTVVDRPADAPPPTVTLTAAAHPPYLETGRATPVTATLTDTGCQQVTDADATLSVPDGWTAEAVTPTHIDSLAAGSSAQVTWQVTPGGPQPTGPVTETLHAAVTYGWSGTTGGSASDSVTVHLGIVPPSAMTATATSWQPGFEPGRAVDDDPATFWHTRFSPVKDVPPQSITLDLGDAYDVTGLRYLPRQDGNLNGTVTAYAVYTSSDGETFTRASSGTWAADASRKSAAVDAGGIRFVRLEGVEARNDNVSAAEVEVLGSRTTA